MNEKYGEKRGDRSGERRGKRRLSKGEDIVIYIYNINKYTTLETIYHFLRKMVMHVLIINSWLVEI